MRWVLIELYTKDANWLCGIFVEDFKKFVFVAVGIIWFKDRWYSHFLRIKSNAFKMHFIEKIGEW